MGASEDSGGKIDLRGRHVSLQVYSGLNELQFAM